VNRPTLELITSQSRQLKMPGLNRSFVELARQAREERWTFEEYLHEVLAAELISRREASMKERLHAARFPEMKTLSDFDLGATDGIDAAVLAQLTRSEWVQRGECVVLAGPIGTGKTHLAIALGIEAARRLHRVSFFRTADLVRTLLEARDERELGRLQQRLRRVALLILDELGFVPFDRTGGELLFNLIADRHAARRSTLVTTNLAFTEWPAVLGGDEKLAAALIDRLAERATILATRGKSFRMRKRKGLETADPSDGDQHRAGGHR
jgi:DNA replication protein DnaC